MDCPLLEMYVLFALMMAIPRGDARMTIATN